MGQLSAKTTRRRGPAWPNEVIRAAQLACDLGATPSQIVEWLSGARAALGIDRVPAISTVKYWNRDRKRGSVGPRWDPWGGWGVRMSDTPSDQAIGLVRHPVTDEQRRRIAPVVVWKARMATRPHHGWLTTEEARWVDRVAGVLPSDAPEVIYLVARAAIDMGDDPDALHALDLELMLYMAGSARTMTHREWAATGASTEVASARMTPIVRVLGAIGDAVGEVEVPGDSVEALARLSVSTHGESAVNDTRAQEDER